MKLKQSTYLTMAFAAALATPAFAIEAPADDTPPPAAPQAAAAGNAAALPEIKLFPDDKQKPEAAADSAFLGVVSGEMPEVLADQLSLKPGEGIVVRSLVPDGPAAKAGLAVNDIVTSVAGQPIGSPADISEKIQTHKPGEEIALGIIHKGKPGELKVMLGARPAGMAAAGPRTLDQMDLDNLPKDLADRVRDAIAGNIGAMDLQLDAAPGQMPDIDQAMRDMQKRMRDMKLRMRAAPAPDDATVQAHSSATIRMKDNDGSVEVKTSDGSKEVTVRDAQDNVTWTGPWDTAQDKAAAPEDVRQRVDSLNLDTNFKGGGLRFQMNKPAPPGN